MNAVYSDFLLGSVPIYFSQSLHLTTTLFHISDKCAGSLDIKTHHATIILSHGGQRKGRSVDFRFFRASIQTVSSSGVWVAYKWNRMGCFISGLNYNSGVKTRRRDLEIVSATLCVNYSGHMFRGFFGRQNSIRGKL